MLATIPVHITSMLLAMLSTYQNLAYAWGRCLSSNLLKRSLVINTSDSKAKSFSIRSSYLGLLQSYISTDSAQDLVNKILTLLYHQWYVGSKARACELTSAQTISAHSLYLSPYPVQREPNILLDRFLSSERLY